ncbi:glutathione S-transferase family protein [Hyphomicrobium sp. CS1BSMeth3]|uniref:glutathione S-transferase family protein n=1 Tax=Hyphomicrobium sp. CS1BSMeth3 TaxID=1892844 RepID=UPI0009300CB7|nr:glutathione S-transferase family protein [Hyphomicrobium sp. CS1BSMeth3]
MLKIYGRADGINVRKVLWLCEEMALTYEREDWGRGYRPTSDPEFQRVSHFGLVPVIEDDGFILRESNSILRYLARKHGRQDLLPEDLRARATVEAWMDWGVSDGFAGLRPVFLGLHAKTPEFVGKSELINWGIWHWNRQLQRLDADLGKSGGPYVCGADFTLADIPVGMIVNRWLSLDFEKPELPAVARYYEQLSTRPAYRIHGRNGTP